jgi:hypothetical protein
MTPPPLDLDIGMLNQKRLMRLAEAMGLSGGLKAWLKEKAAFDQASGTMANAPGA